MPFTEEQKRERRKEASRKYMESNREKMKEYHKNYNKNYRKANREKLREYEKNWKENNREKVREYDRKYKENNPEKVHKSGKISLWKHHGLIDEDYESLYNKYMNTDYCERCNCKLTGNKPQTSTSRCMDHDHITGKFRNVLCLCCNSSLPKQTKKIINNIKKDEN